MHRQGTYGLATLVAAVLAAGCSDLTPTGVPTPDAAAPRSATSETCEVIDFNGFAHGASITSLSLLGMNLSVSMTPSPLPWSGANPFVAPAAWDTDEDPASWEDADLLWKQPGGRCAGCNGLGRVMIIPDERGFPYWGDSRYGGRIDITGFTGQGLYVHSFKAVDDDAAEPDIRLVVGADTVGKSAGLGNGSVETVMATPHTIGGSIAFVYGTMETDPVLGSGGVDDIRICRAGDRPEEPTGNEGCTLGYWKQKHHFDSWVGYTQAQKLNTVFDFTGGASAVASLGNDSMLDALNYRGGSDLHAAARLLLKQAVPGLLSAASPGVDYTLTTAQIVSRVNDALDSGSRDAMLALADELDGYNNKGCPLS
jgi:hypothetical protein